MFTNNKLSKAVRLAVAFGAVSTVAFTGAAFAQDAAQKEESAEKVERIDVTGSRIRQTDIETAQPVFTLDRMDIANQGFTSVTDILQNMSSTGAPPISRSAVLSSGENVGGNYANLRNLGANRTLVLVNGKRLGITTSGLQDLSAIPMSMVERVDVLKDGASTIYGSDAMAGVVNIITRKDFEGLELIAYTGEYDQGDGAKTNISLVGGVAGEKGSITWGAEWRDEEEVWAKDREFSKLGRPDRDDYASNYTLVGQYGRFSYNGQWWVADRPGAASDFANDFHVQQAASASGQGDTTNTNDTMHVLSPLSARSLYLSSNYSLAENIKFTSDIGFTNRSSTRQIAGYPLQSASTFGAVSGWYLDANSYFNPVDTNVRFTRRGWEVPRTTESKQDTLRATAALEGSFDIGERYFDWDVGGVYSQSTTLQIGRGDFHVPNTVLATGPSFMNAQGIVQCGTAASPIPLTRCVPWNPLAGYGAGTTANSLEDPAVQAFLFPTSHARGETTSSIFFANIGGLLFTLPAGDVTFAVGTEHRKEDGAFSPDALAQSGMTTTLAAGPTKGTYDLDEYYAELNVPIISEMEFAQEVSLSLASRYSDYSSFGDTTNSKIGLKWKPIDSLLVRATASEGFRAPTISNLYGGGSQSFVTGFIDPCDSVYGVAKGTARCLQDVPADYRQLQQGFIPTTGPAAQTPVPFNSGSNPLLQPETSETTTVGFVWSPEFVENLNVVFDWWNIKIEDTMVTDSANAIVDDCYVGLIESRCAMFSRDPVNHIVSNLTYGLRNAGITKTAGFDLGLAYKYETEFGTFGTNWNTTYTDKYDSKSTNDPEALLTPSVGYGSTFRVRSNLGLSWNLGDFGVNWTMRYYSSTKERCYYTDKCSLPDFKADWTNDVVTPYNRYGSTTFNDVQFSYHAPWEARISVGANNVFEKYGPIMYSQPSSNFAYYGGFDIGRFFYVRYEQKF
ncbi:TonB-dependent receptor domain-containing protein [Rheinheimera marina]|uniref:TonB-dependent receptor domain-containing protein n=1 Tax=Rheinheimera marina TaxID=1774958 RepID=A0ABV9JNR1_9GAMM